jgi:hypothetical protein
MSEWYKSPVAFINNTGSKYNYWVLATDTIRNEIALFSYGHLTDELGHRLIGAIPNRSFGGLATFQNNAPNNSNIEEKEGKSHG